LFAPDYKTVLIKVDHADGSYVTLTNPRDYDIYENNLKGGIKMRKIVLLVIVFMLVSALVAFGGKEGARSIQEVVEQHHNKVGASIKDVGDILADYADDAIFIMPDKNLVGKEAIEVAFTDFFKAFPNLRFTETQIRIEGDMVLIMWKGECDTGTIPHAIDTFIIRDDRIQRQTCWLAFVPK